MTRLPKIIGDTWFNLPGGKQSLKPEDLAGKAVLIDFWTYSCVNCQRTLPYLREWWKKYQGKDFLMIGIHTPEFEFEKDPKNVAQAIKDLEVSWPVVLDNDYANWNNFANRYWPAKYLADRSGKIVYTHFGEGAYAETEKAIQKLLGGKVEAMPEISEDEHEHGKVCFIPTPETYCGYARGSIANREGYVYDQIFDYQPSEKIPADTIALSGKFLVRPEYVESREAGAALLLNFRATEVNLVLRPAGGTIAVAEILLDGRPLKELEIKEPTMYNLLKSQDLVEGVLTIKAKRGNFQAYAFTFSGCA